MSTKTSEATTPQVNKPTEETAAPFEGGRSELKVRWQEGMVALDKTSEFNQHNEKKRFNIR